MDAFSTHEVANQPPELAGTSLFDSNRPLREGVEAAGAGWALERLEAFGALAGATGFREHGRLANRFAPELRTHDRFGNRIDEVDFHPSWHEVMRSAMAHGVHNLPWRESRTGAQVARSALHSMLSQVEAGACCPLTMTFAARPALAAEPEIAQRWESGLLGTEYQPALVPPRDKAAVLIGMAMTEKQGGSDVRSNTTRAEPDGEAHRLVGHKWFCSAPMSDAFLTLAWTGRGLTCFLVPRILPDGSRNAIRIQRLKEKLGNRSNASSEIEYTGAFAEQVGEEGRGVRTIVEMVHHTRLDCVSGSTGLMREALAQALHHTAHREAFGHRLSEQPLMRSVLADLCLEVEAATVLMLRLAEAFDPDADEGERAFARIATAVAKYQVCKRAPGMIGEAMECLGGAGYVEESILPRLYREAPVNAIWEGSGNVMCLDVLRAMVREPASLEALLAEIHAADGADPRLDEASRQLEKALADPSDIEAHARSLVQGLATVLQCSLLYRRSPSAVAEAFSAARLGRGASGSASDALFALAPLHYGALPRGMELQPILDRSSPHP